MSRRHDREGNPPVPGYYKFPLRRPHMLDAHVGMAWDQCSTWITASEWLAWLRRRGSRRSYMVYGGKHTMGRWVPEARPIIKAHSLHWSTRKVRGFARLDPVI